MTKNEFLVLRNYYKFGNQTVREISKNIEISLGSISKCIKSLKKLKAVNEKGITKEGLNLLENFKVENAIIMAAGMSTRLAPLSFDKPKGLFEVKGEILIERQIKQLKEVGIDKITLVLGYKKESFFYLGEKYNVDIIINPSFNTKNNCETLFLARNKLNKSYICSCDQYFTVNPFNKYEYQSFYTAVNTNSKTDEPYIKSSTGGRISSISYGKNKGTILLGFSYWDKDFSSAFKQLLEEHHNIGDYDNSFWEKLFFDHLNKLPDMYVSIRDENTIFEFDNFNQLRKFDKKYVENTTSSIMKNIANILGCREGEIEDFLPIKEGMTNTSYTFMVGDNKYVYRHPGDGTEKIIKRASEEKSLKLAKELGIDPTYIHMDAEKGWKISSFASGCREPDYNCFEDSKLIIKKMKELHGFKRQVEWSFRPWEDSLVMEDFVKQNSDFAMHDFEQLKSDIFNIYESVKNDGLVEKCFCHCDTYKPNWLINKDNNVILIDWEYAGYSDPAVDVCYYIVDAMYDFDDALKFIDEYIGDKHSKELEKHFVSYIAIVAYYWFVWALFREACGAIMGEALYNWYYMAKKYARYVLENY